MGIKTIQLHLSQNERTCQTVLVTKRKEFLDALHTYSVEQHAERRLLWVYSTDSRASSARVLARRTRLRGEQSQHAVQLQPRGGGGRGWRERSAEVSRDSVPAVYPTGSSLRDERGVCLP